jgi:hypothetical protein
MALDEEQARIVERLQQIKDRAAELNMQAEGTDTPAALAEEAAGLGLQLAGAYEPEEEEVE